MLPSALRLPSAAATAVSLALLLPACGGGGDAGDGRAEGTAPTVSAVSAQDLAYGQRATFTITGTQLAGGATYVFSGCDGVAAGAAAGATTQTFSCVPDRSLAVRVTTRWNGADVHSALLPVPKPQVTMTTTQGSFVVELEPAAAPVTVDNFLAYVQDGFYDGTLFHRVIPGFVNQGGGFTAVQSGGLLTKPGVRAPIALETNRGLSNTRGTLAMARTPAPDSATSQFFVNVADNSRALDWASAALPGYAVFGRVVDGMPVMDAINAATTRSVAAFDDVPETDIVLTSARRTR